MIDVRNLTKRYGNVTAVRDATFAVQVGEVVGFVGPNGAGKSTTIKMLACLLPPTSGTASIAGRDTVSGSMDARRSLGYLPEAVALYPDMTVRAYLNYMAALHDVPKPQRAERVGQAILDTGLAEYADRSVGVLSKGYRQRLGIAQAIVHDPPALVLDEPANGLDPAQMVEMRKLIRRLGKEHAVLLSSHLLSEVALVCDRVVVINRGSIVGDGTLGELGRTAGLGPLATAESIFLALTGVSEGAAADA
jgi:ABC-2 type transport system ATP-binding protein